MKCKKCGEEMDVQITNDVQIKKGHSIIWWLIIGWWYKPIMYLCFGIFYLIFVVIFRKTRVKNKIRKVYVCRKCGYIEK